MLIATLGNFKVTGTRRKKISPNFNNARHGGDGNQKAAYNIVTTWRGFYPEKRHHTKPYLDGMLKAAPTYVGEKVCEYTELVKTPRSEVAPRWKPYLAT